MFFKNYRLSLAFVILFIVSIICSSWTQIVLDMPVFVLRMLTVIGYSPFLLWIFRKAYFDIKSNYGINNVSLWYHIFFLYFSVVFITRLIMGNEVKESLYYFITLMGVIAFIILASSDKMFNFQIVKKNICVCELVLVIFCGVYYMVGYNFFYNPPINVNITSCALLLLVIYHAYLIYKRLNNVFDEVMFLLDTLLVLMSGSRGCFLLLVIFIIIFIVYGIIKNANSLSKIILLLFFAMLFLVLFYIVDFRGIRSTVTRELLVVLENGEQNSSSMNTFGDSISIQNEQAQIERSDSGRILLFKKGINEIRKEPLLGTGNVTYEEEIYYGAGESFTTKQSSHNFLIESCVCFGVIGAIIGFAIHWKLLRKVVFCKENGVLFFAVSVVGAFLGFCLVQPLYFNEITLLIYSSVLLCVYKSSL